MAARQKDVSKEALSRLPKLDIYELREEWRRLYKADASPHLSRELLIRAVAYRMQEVALGGLRPEPQRQLRQIAIEVKQTGQAAKHFRPQLKPGTRLMREWQGRTYEVVVLDDGLSWQGTQYRSLSAIVRKITGTAWSGPLFFGLKQTRSASRGSSHASVPICGTMEARHAAE
ncbi:MAG TPA: DUF2924 domain-containing protein [Candidatus Eisenbacteria bacterium]|nr:DUF2924 domain-containing protein [Candidatus Eisenbacteria bacterium]